MYKNKLPKVKIISWQEVVYSSQMFEIKKKPDNSFVRLMYVCSDITPIIAIIFIKSIA